MTLSPKIRNIIISIFVICWLLLFHYESIRYFYLQPHFKQPLPKLKFLFPPAGWIMFFNVDDRYSYAEVYGIKNGIPQMINAHDIVKTRFIGFDMVQRNVLSTVLEPRLRPSFCGAMHQNFPEFDRFIVTIVQYPALTKSRYERQQAEVYQCQ
jgi:hypothetical protein